MNRTERFRILAATLLLAMLLVPPAPARAQSATGGSAGGWLSQYQSARSMGLGGAFVAAADDPFGVLWNPAGLSLLDQNQVRFETAAMLEGTSTNGLSFAAPGSRLPSFGVSLVSLSSGDFEKTDALNNSLGSFKEGETAYLLTLSKSVTPRLAIGLNGKFVQQSLESYSGGGFGFDAGAMLSVTPNLRVGFSVLNLGGPSVTLSNTAEPWPTEVRGGLSVALLDGRALASVEVDNAPGAGTRFRGGTELKVIQGITLRGGYDDTRGTGGLSYRFAPKYELDYGVADHPLGLTHRIGVSYKFGGYFASSHADPAAFSPTGERSVTQIALNARTKGAAESWNLSILDKSDRVVRKFGGPGAPAPHVEWDGKDEYGLPLADGIYRYRLEVKDRDGRLLTSTIRALEITTAGPQGTVPVVQTP